MAQITKLQPGTPIFDKIVDTALIDLGSVLAAVSIDVLQDAAEAELVAIVGAAAMGLAKQFYIDDVRKELLAKHGVLTIPVYKSFFTKRLRLRALQGYIEYIPQADGSTRAVKVPPNPVELLPIGHGKIKSGLVKADNYPTLLATWTKQDRLWANGSWSAYDRRLGEVYDAGLLDRPTLQELVSSNTTSTVPVSSNLARIIADVKALGIVAIAGPTP